MIQITTEKSNRAADSIPDSTTNIERNSPQGTKPENKIQWCLTIILLVITIGHYSFPEEYSIAHNILQRLYYVPIVWAAYHFGKRGGMLVSAISGILYLPHVLFGWQAHPEYQVNQVIEILLFQAIGLGAGHLFEQKVLTAQQLRSYEKMALFGKLSRTIIRSLKGPLRAIKGMLMAIEPMERQDKALELHVQVIREEVTRIETVRDDLISLVERRKLRLKKQNLNNLIFEFISQIETGLSVNGTQVKKKVQDMKLMAHCNKKALLNALHQLLGCITEGRPNVQNLTFYTGQSSTYLWLGATTNGILLPERCRNDNILLNTHDFHEYELISIMNVMNNHFGDAVFRWQDHSLIEFILLFPKKLKLPWYLRDESQQQKSMDKGGLRSISRTPYVG